MTAAKRILLVEDDQAIRDIVALALEGEGHEVAAASDGAGALDRVAGATFDVIVLDLRLPGMDGREFVQRYRESGSAGARLVLMTASTDGDALAAELGARSIAKPFDLPALLALVAE
ncbi:MAG TPA: response regulator [Candidatus Limnocylindria bacterium]